MNKDNAHEYLPLVQALADGKTIQSELPKGWCNLENVNFSQPSKYYRVKPEPRTFDIVKSRQTNAIYSASEWDGTSPNIWERITVQEVLK